MNIERVTEASPELVETIRALLPQLTEARTPPTLDELGEVVANQTLLIARGDDGGILEVLGANADHHPLPVVLLQRRVLLQGLGSEGHALLAFGAAASSGGTVGEVARVAALLVLGAACARSAAS